MKKESLRFLKSKIVLNNYTIAKLTTVLKISNQAWYNKINGITEFTRFEIEQICNILDLNAQERDYIFFNQTVE